MRKRGGVIFVRVGMVLIGLAMLAETIGVVRPLSKLAPRDQANITIPTKAVSLAWPSEGQSAISADGFGLLASNGTQKPVPIASVAKVVTALAVLKQKPLGANDAGPTLTMTQADVDIYSSALRELGSVVPVAVGEKISERQALEAMLVPSANNMARSLAQWAFGSLDAYNAYANKMVKDLGLSQTTITDASGFSPGTVSTAEDLVKLGLTAIKQPALAQIVSEPNAQLPVVGQVQNINTLLGSDGFVGIKTGNTDQAGGCFLFSAKHTVGKQDISIVGAVVGAPTLPQSLAQARSLAQSVDSNFVTARVIDTGEAVGLYKARWGVQTKVFAERPATIIHWSDQPVRVSFQLNKIKAGTKAGSDVGKITAQSNGRSISVPLITGNDLPKPSIWWRLVHP